MGRTAFVAWLFVTAAACVVIAIGDRSLGWLIGGIVLFSVAVFARRQLNKERETASAAPRFGFVGIAMLVMLLGIFFLYWLQTSA